MHVATAGMLAGLAGTNVHVPCIIQMRRRKPEAQTRLPPRRGLYCSSYLPFGNQDLIKHCLHLEAWTIFVEHWYGARRI